MTTGMSQQEQQRRTCAAFRSTALSTYELWLRYFSLGGNAGEEEIDAYLYSSLLLPPFDRDILALAVNEFIADQPPLPRAPYGGMEGPHRKEPGGHPGGTGRQGGERDGPDSPARPE